MLSNFAHPRFFIAAAMLSGICLGRMAASPGWERLSEQGSGRATAYLESPKIVRFEGKTHIAWLDSPAEGFRVRIRTLDNASGTWSKPFEVGEAYDNHGGPALVVDESGYLHLIYYAHHHPVRYRRSLRPNDASAWTEYEEFGRDLTYPAVLCARDGTLVLVARRSYEDKPWEAEMWQRAPDGVWESRGAVLRSRSGDYAQFAVSLAWGSDHQTLHLGTRIYETDTDPIVSPVTTVAYLKSPDGGRTWERSDGTPVSLPATADSADVIASGRGKEGRVLHGGSIAVDPEGVAFVPYSVRVQASSQAYVAVPQGDGRWSHTLLNPSLPPAQRDWAVLMHGGISFGSEGEALVATVAMRLEPDGVHWGEPTSELVLFYSSDGGRSYRGRMWGSPDPATPRWMPNLERATGFNQMPLIPSLVFTEGHGGGSLSDRLSNRVYWLPGETLR